MRQLGLALGIVIFLCVATPCVTSAADICDRNCLIGIMNHYLDAVCKHDPSKAPLAPNYRSTENAVDVKPGTGMWMTATALGEMQRRYADPVSKNVGYFGLIDENGNTALVSVRLKIEGQKISEAEWTIARKGATVFRPQGIVRFPPPKDPAGPEHRSSRESMIAAADSYFSGIQGHDGNIVLAQPGCYRVENGTWMVGATPGHPLGSTGPVNASLAKGGDGVTASYFANSQCNSGFPKMMELTEAVINRRYSIADEEAGIVVATVIFKRVPGATQNGVPFRWLYLTELFQIENGRIRAIFAAMDSLPPEIQTSGWPDEKR
ncbi:MAG TPA: hypothetical protein VMT62_17955 [Syntrophorhabdaceae bacterium]|nr:hypothetical protein [Syntrophorhabdaceae bacterium]